MKKTTFIILALIFSVLGSSAQRSRVSFNKGWKFFLGDAEKAKNASFNDLKWRGLTLPHDWSIEGAFDEKNPAKPEGGGLPTGIGWYRKSFIIPTASAGKLVTVEFDGVYRHSEVWVNGHYLGKRPNGYISFQYDLTPYLKFGGKNVIAVRVDNSGQANSRWYSGSGIYRNVWLETRSMISIDKWESSVTASCLSGDNGDGTCFGQLKPGEKFGYVRFKTNIVNASTSKSKITIKTTIYDKNGQVVSTLADKKNIEIDASSGSLFCQSDLYVKSPELWSTEKPTLYKGVVELLQNGKAIDSYTVNFGIRYFNFDAEKGFSLNGEPMKILGVCNHHDLGALGAAFNTRAAERQLEILKAMGCNALRTAHNPPAPELLDLCDKMGFLVMDESFDMWKKKKTSKDYHLDFPEWHKRDLEDMIKRDRNHPSIILWSIGNEIREQFDSTGISITKELTRIVKNLDTSRPVISALTELVPEKNFIYQSGVLDIYGLNYNHKFYKEFPSKYPGQKFLATETTSALQTRGFYDMPTDTIRLWPTNGKTKLTDGNAEIAVTSYDNVAAYWGSSHEQTWKEAKKFDYVSGLFVWTGFDYLGEPTPYPWPARSSYFGIVDLAGFPKDAYYMYQSEWTNTPVLHLLPHWNWKAGQTIPVWAYYNNADEVELFLNGKSLGIQKKTGEDLHVEWKVPYQAGTLKAVSRKDGKVVLTKEVKTAGDPYRIELIADRKNIAADGKDLSFITVNILDKDGNMVPNADNLVKFAISGNGFIAGVDNGYQASMESFKVPYRKAWKGKCLAIIQSTNKAGNISLTATSAALQSNTITLKSK